MLASLLLTVAAAPLTALAQQDMSSSEQAPDDVSVPSQTLPVPVHVPTLLAASSDQHQWYVRTRQIDSVRSYVLLHHGPGMDDPANASLVHQSFRSQPEAIAADGRDLYVIFGAGPAPTDVAVTSQAGRTVIMLRAITYNERTGTWMHSAQGRVRTLPSLPPLGRVIGFEVYPEYGPVVLIHDPLSTPMTGDDAGAEAGRAESSETPASRPLNQEYLLYRIGAAQWQPWPLDPITAPGSAPAGMKLLDGQVPRLVVTAAGGPEDAATSSGTHVWTPAKDEFGRWIDSGPMGIVSAEIEDSAELHGRTFVLTNREQDGQQPRVCLVLDDNDLLPIATLPAFEGERRLIKAGPGLGIVGQVSSSSSLQLTQIDVETGLIGKTAVVEPPTPLTTDWFRPLILIAGLLLAGIVMFVFRPERRTATLALPPGMSLAEPQVRFLAVVVDLAICALPALFVTGGSPADLIRTPLLATSWSHVVPALAMYMMCCMYSFIAEWTTARTLGKALFNLRVSTVSGSRPGFLQAVVRNLMKFIVLLIPPLVLFVMMNPLRQRLGDQAARTIVLLIEDAGDGESDKRDDALRDESSKQGTDEEDQVT